MVKKVSLFFHSELRKRMESEPEFRRSPALRAAMSFPGELMAWLLFLPPWTRTIFASPVAKLISSSLKNELLERIETVSRIEIVFMPIHSVIRLTIDFFKRGAKEAIVRMNVAVHADGKIFLISSMTPE